MRSRNKTPLLGWHPPAELLARVEAEVERRGGARGVKSEVLSEAVTKGLDAMSTATGES